MLMNMTISFQMHMKNFVYDPDHWRDRAEKTRVKAESFAYRQSKDRLLKIAEEYDRLALHAEQLGKQE
jgi:hypothetical protein